MSLNFIPHQDDAHGTLPERIELLMEAAERYKAIMLDDSSKSVHTETEPDAENKRGSTPSELKVAYNWETITHVLHEIRDLPEANPNDKSKKSHLLMKLAEVYEVLRGAKMSKLEAVRVALMSEANHLQGKP